jgi:hypothetical protein
MDQEKEGKKKRQSNRDVDGFEETRNGQAKTKPKSKPNNKDLSNLFDSPGDMDGRTIRAEGGTIIHVNESEFSTRLPYDISSSDQIYQGLHKSEPSLPNDRGVQGFSAYNEEEYCDSNNGREIARTEAKAKINLSYRQEVRAKNYSAKRIPRQKVGNSLQNQMKPPKELQQQRKRRQDMKTHTCDAMNKSKGVSHRAPGHIGRRPSTSEGFPDRSASQGTFSSELSGKNAIGEHSAVSRPRLQAGDSNMLKHEIDRLLQRDFQRGGAKIQEQVSNAFNITH